MFPESLNDIRLGIVGLGYVGLPVAVAFGKTSIQTLGFDINSEKISQLRQDYDAMDEVSEDELQSTDINYTDDPSDLAKCNFLIVAVPTPIDDTNKPDLLLIKKASEMIGRHLSEGTIVVFESTVYPGLTEEICVPIIEEFSGLKCGSQWKIGYSPERINPGDKHHTIDKIVKVVAGMDQESSNIISIVYQLICKAGVHIAPNIKTAEAAKIIENVQRDLNIALINELSIIFKKMGIHTKDVLEAAETKWNFHSYRPGLVGGHCIGVDPYYLTHRAEELGYHPQIILAGRRINDSMATHVAKMMMEGLMDADLSIPDSRVLVLGLTFKENVRDTRNSKIKDTIRALLNQKVQMFGYDPLLTKEEIESFGIKHLESLDGNLTFDGLILNSFHQDFSNLDLDFFTKKLSNGKGVFIDIKGHFLSQYKKLDTSPFIYKCL